jgi:hypothetical protein
MVARWQNSGQPRATPPNSCEFDYNFAPHIVRETASAKEWPDFPGDALAIGANGGGDVLVLLPDPAQDRYGDCVYWWDHETGDLTKVAEDFAELECEGSI